MAFIEQQNAGWQVALFKIKLHVIRTFSKDYETKLKDCDEQDTAPGRVPSVFKYSILFSQT